VTGAATLLLAATLATIELTWTTRVLAAFSELGGAARRAGRIVVRRPRSDWAKERAMRLMSLRLMGHSLRSAGLLAIIASPLLIALAVDALGHVGLARAYTDWPARAVLLAVSGGYWAVRRPRRRTARPASPRVERAWQRLALGHRAVLDITFDLERAAFKPWPAGVADSPIFVAGLPRAGTTILTRRLHEQFGLASLTYRDLPFPLASNGWAAVSARLGRQVARAERGHGDGILHDLDSAEAIEEVFWRHFEGLRYADAAGLAPVAPQPDTVAAFRDYVGLVRRRHAGARYLSKNNANVLRLPALIEAFPDAVLVHPFRAPLQQAQSLLRQHRLARQLAAADPYRAEFMGWLGHHEFGADQRPYLFPGHPPADGDRDHVDYWLRLWISVHRALLAQPEPVRARQVFVDYDALCRDPAAAAGRLATALALDGLALHDLRAPPPHTADDASRSLLARAHVVHVRLIDRAAQNADQMPKKTVLLSEALRPLPS
jgi:hypothetical protein